jgi:predicted transcriptional regulator
MSKTPATYVIASRKQLTALVSAARQEIVDVLAQMGTVSVAELAETLGRPADALYYHLRILRVAGLIQEDGSRVRGGKREALFRAVGSELRIDYETSRQESVQVLSSIVSSMLRLGIRDFRQAIRNEDVVVSGTQRELWALRRTGWLVPKEVARINHSIEQLAVAVSRPRGRGELYGITILLTPLNRKRRGTGRKSKSPRGSSK